MKWWLFLKNRDFQVTYSNIECKSSIITFLLSWLEWDYLSWNILGFPAFWTPIWQATTFKGMGCLLTEFVSKYENHQSIQASGEQVIKMYNAVWRRVVIINLLVLPSIACNVISTLLILYLEHLSTEAACLLAFIISTQGYIYFIPPSSSGMDNSPMTWISHGRYLAFSITAIIEMLLFFLGRLSESMQLYLSSLQAILEER